MSEIEIPEELLFSRSHEWVRREGDLVTVGISHHAENLLGDIVFVELPEEEDALNKGEAFGVVESVKAASDVYAPVSGEVASVNSELEDSPALVNQSPYGDGWFLQLKNVDESDLSELLNAEDYAKFIEGDEQ